jgi:hypothetical protein
MDGSIAPALDPKLLGCCLNWNNLAIDKLADHALFRVDDAAWGKEAGLTPPLHQGQIVLAAAARVADRNEIGIGRGKVRMIDNGLDVYPMRVSRIRFGQPSCFQKPIEP